MNKSVQKKVLVVDDEPDICYLFSRILLKRDIKTGYANNLAEAYQALESEPPSLVFLDNSLPDGQGMELIPYLKLHYPGTRVVVVTANDSASDKYNAFQLGADDFIGKPISLELINRTLDKINGNPKSG